MGPIPGIGASTPYVPPTALDRVPPLAAQPASGGGARGLADQRATADSVGKAFEGIFASLILKQMRESLETGMFGGDRSEVLGGLFDHFIGEHIANSGGLGIAAMVRAQLERRIERTPTQ